MYHRRAGGAATSCHKRICNATHLFGNAPPKPNEGLCTRPQTYVCSAKLRRGGFAGWEQRSDCLSMLTWINQRWWESDSYMVRGHEIKVVAVVGVEGHDVMDRLAGRQLQCPLIGQGHVRQEGQLWGGDESRGHRLDRRCRQVQLSFFSRSTQQGRVSWAIRTSQTSKNRAAHFMWKFKASFAQRHLERSSFFFPPTHHDHASRFEATATCAKVFHQDKYIHIIGKL